MTRPIGYITNPLVRHSAERDPEALAKAVQRSPRRHGRSSPATCRSSGPESRGRACIPPPILSRLPAHREQVFLGTLDDRPVVATLAAPEAAEPFQDDPAFAVVDLRSIAVRGLVPAEELGHARHGEIPARLAPAPPLLRQLRRADASRPGRASGATARPAAPSIFRAPTRW